MVTEKQASVIKFIESNLSIKFEGNTKEQATTFISENINKSKLARSNYNLTVNNFNRGEFFGIRTGDMKDVFGTYKVCPVTLDIFEDDDYDYHAYADFMFSTF